uniref:TonB-dependent hemoglobin/transferrin/lactoferrin family receptor n=1 Tax=Thaumasiovibrio occultus TaxID=1891184 RepID=UPI000B3582EF|nr:TonB-dependent hemoglobin/transferrin/lactoferrin family receptor [Thaumasiovibrio occultus]
MKVSKIALFVGLACSPWASANEVYTFDEVVVSATRTEQEVKDVAASVATVSSEEIANGMSQNLQQALKSEPGVTMEGQGRYGLSGFNIRGREENYVKVMVDGVEQAGSYNPGADVMRKTQNMVEVDTLTGIEVNKGPISSLYGSDALAGAVIMRTYNPEDFLEDGDSSYASLKGGYASVDESIKTTVTLANRAGDLESLFIYTLRDGHETSTHGSGADINGRDRGQADPFDIRQDNFLGKLYYQVNDAHRIGFTAEIFNREAKGDLLHNEGYEMMPGYLYTQNRGEDEDQRQRYSVEHEWLAYNRAFDELKWQLALQRSFSNHDTYDHTPTNGYRNRQRNGSDESTQFDLQMVKLLEAANSYHEITYGTAYRNNRFELDYNNIMFKDGSVVGANPEVPNAESDTWGIYIQDQGFYMDENLVVTLGLRYDNFTAAPDQGSHDYPDNENDALTGRLGAVYHWNDSLSTYATIAQGFKSPTLKDLYYFYNHGAEFRANPNLKAEESLAYEIGSRFGNQLVKVETSAFYNDYSNFIKDVKLGTNADGKDVWTKQNVANAYIWGLELSSEFNLAAIANAPQGTYADLSLAYAQGEDRDNGEAINSVAPLKAYAALGYDAPNGKMGGRLSLEAVAGKEGNDWADEVNIKAPGYAVTDITVYYRPVTDLTLRAGVFNVFDTKYWHYSDLDGVEADDLGIDRRSQPGRNWGVEFEYQY